MGLFHINHFGKYTPKGVRKWVLEYPDRTPSPRNRLGGTILFRLSTVQKKVFSAI